MTLVTALDARNWNTGILGLVFIGLLLWPVYQSLVDRWGGRRRRKKRERAESDTPPTQPGS